ncbi:MAG TPA: hypothetical protein VI195_06220 [Steroidobacteraceae bacterium]
MEGLPPAVRRKAIEVANALLRGGHPEGQSIRIGIASARKWAAHHRALAWRPGWPDSSA